MVCIPRAFVGIESSLQQLVKLICVEMHRAFTTQNVSIPPWRSKESFLSKWKVPQSVRGMPDVRLSPQRQHGGVFKASRPAMRKCSHNGAPAGSQGLPMPRVRSFCRVDSHGALSSASEDNWPQEQLIPQRN